MIRLLRVGYFDPFACIVSAVTYSDMSSVPSLSEGRLEGLLGDAELGRLLHVAGPVPVGVRGLEGALALRIGDIRREAVKGMSLSEAISMPEVIFMRFSGCAGGWHRLTGGGSPRPRSFGNPSARVCGSALSATKGPGWEGIDDDAVTPGRPGANFECRRYFCFCFCFCFCF